MQQEIGCSPFACAKTQGQVSFLSLKLVEGQTDALVRPETERTPE